MELVIAGLFLAVLWFVSLWRGAATDRDFHKTASETRQAAILSYRDDNRRLKDELSSEKKAHIETATELARLHEGLAQLTGGDV